MKKLLLIAVFISSADAYATLTLTSSNSISNRLQDGAKYLVWPLLDLTADGDDNYCMNARSYPSNLGRLNPTTDNLIFQIATTTTANANTRYIIAKFLSGGIEAVGLSPVIQDNGLTYSQYTGDPNGGTVGFSLRLSDLCKATMAGSLTNPVSANCQFNAGSATAMTRISIPLRIGVTTSQTGFDSNQSNSTATQDYENYFIDLVRCASINTAFFAGTAPTNDSYFYKLSVYPRDSGARVTVDAIPQDVSAYFPYMQTLVLFKEGSAPLTSAMDIAGANNIVAGTGTNIGDYTVNGLTNDTVYNVQMAYVNVGGLVTPPGPPYYDGSIATSLQVTPSQIDGFLSKDDCPISSAEAQQTFFYSEKRIDVFRDFRDEILLKSEVGKHLVEKYYDSASVIQKWFRQHPVFFEVFKLLLVPLALLSQCLLFFQGAFVWVVLSIVVFLALLGLKTLGKIKNEEKN